MVVIQGGIAGFICICKKEVARIRIWGYADNEDILLCETCSLQLARKLLEDVCELRGDKNG